jgi:AcrR family transcriptional regulator
VIEVKAMATNSAEGNSRDRILDAAEQLFSEQGISGTSLRALTRAAGVNLAAVHYYFGSKEALLNAVIARRAEPVNAQRLLALETMLSSREEPEVEAILEAFVFPPLSAVSGSSEQEQRLGRLTARIEAQPPELVESLSREHFGEVASHFVDALQKALPHLRKDLVADRFRYAAGLFSFLFSGNFDLDTLPGHPPQPRSLEQKLSEAIGFIAAGIRAEDPMQAKHAQKSAHREVAA